MRLVVSQVAPLISLRRLAYHSAITELLCVLSVVEDLFDLKEPGVSRWDAEATASGGVGLDYAFLKRFPTSSGEFLNQLVSV